MTLFQASSPQVEVSGETVRAIVAGMGSYAARALKMLAQHGMGELREDQWYPQQAWLDVFRDIAGSLGPSTLYRIGMKIPDTARFPPDLSCLHQALASIDAAYHLNHRGGEIGCYAYTATGARSGRMVCANPYPSDFDRGIIQAMANHFQPPGSLAKVSLDPSQPSRLQGGDRCTFLIQW